ncbi:hypothetical protein ACT3TP_02690 [Glutamicibacter sp. AOP38-B1-38]|uniref:hypothetical protein n=1 Tax=unclassified Glutamicibacter TaxID=2627139 RepID=UPI00403408F8
MRSSKPMPGNPWPHDMAIAVDDRPSLLLELLWIREAYELEPPGEDLPPLLSDTPVVVRDAVVSTDTRAKWEYAWPRFWHAAAHADMAGPGWREEFGDDAFDSDSYRTWSQRGWDAYLATLPARVEDSPEWRDLPDLIPAWRAGLRRIITIPCSGAFTRKLGENALLMAFATRENSDSYRQALSMFV